MQRPDFKTARQQLTGGMPTGEYRMADVEVTLTRKVATVPPQPATQDILYFASFEDFERWYDEQQS